jgi:hypothetical protein
MLKKTEVFGVSTIQIYDSPYIDNRIYQTRKTITASSSVLLVCDAVMELNQIIDNSILCTLAITNHAVTISNSHI